MRSNRVVGAATFLGFLVAAAGGCDLVAGIGTWCTEGVDPGCGTGGASTGGGGTASTGGAGGTTTSDTGGGGSGGAGECTPPATQECYGGPDGTKGVGLCKAGTQTCQPDGTWGACTGEIGPKPEDCSAPGDEDCNFGVGCSETLWGKLFGDASDQQMTEVAFDAEGNLYAVGALEGTVDFGGGPLISSGSNDVFVVKLDPMGNHVWSRRYGDAAMQSARAAVVDAEGNLILAGNFAGSMEVDGETLTSAGNEDVFVIKLNSAGAKVWARRFGDANANQLGNDVAVDSDGNVFVVGGFNGELDFDGETITAIAGGDAYVAKLTPNGTGLWAIRLGDAQGQTAIVAGVDAAGNLAVAGNFLGTITLPGLANMPVATGPDVFVARFDSGGAGSWVQKIDAESQVFATGLAIDAVGDVIVALEVDSNTQTGGGVLAASPGDIALVKYTSGGTFQWHKAIDGSSGAAFPRLAVDADERIVLAFEVTGAVDVGTGELGAGGSYDVVLSMLEPDGEVLWANRYGMEEEQWSAKVAVGPKGQIGLGLTANGGINFGGGVLTPMGYDVGLAVIGPN